MFVSVGLESWVRTRLCRSLLARWHAPDPNALEKLLVNQNDLLFGAVGKRACWRSLIDYTWSRARTRAFSLRDIWKLRNRSEDVP